MRILVGTSGWVYPSWRQDYYPAGIPQRAWLTYLAQRLDAVEVNSTFYGSLRPQVFAGWRAQVPVGFRFAVKGSRFITHTRRLADPVRPLANFFAQGVLALGDTLGPILWQLPPTLAFDPVRLGGLFSVLPRTLGEAERLMRQCDPRFAARAHTPLPGVDRRTPLRYAVEPRHPSFDMDDFFSLCAEADIAVVLADTAGRHPVLQGGRPSLAYLRLHGSRRLYASGYTDEELAAWAARVHQLGAGETYVFFDNDALGHAPHDAEKLRGLLTPAPAHPENP